MMQMAQLLFPVNVPGAFDYLVPQDLSVEVGSFVFAPLGRQVKIGVVCALERWEGQGKGLSDRGTGKAALKERKLKQITGVKSTRSLPAPMIEFIMRAARYNCCSPGLVLRMVMRSVKALDPSPTVTLYKPVTDRTAGLTAARARVITQGGPFPARAATIAERAGVSSGVIKAMSGAGALTAMTGPVDQPFEQPDPDKALTLSLSASQKEAGQALQTQMRARNFNVSLLDGVTGSGKTEVYFEAVADVLRQGRQALILLPEIALTQAALKRFYDRFGAEPAIWHSSIGATSRRRTWREVIQGRARLVIGARSALFLPFPNLGVVIIDEEHDSSYKQEEGVIYNARDMAVLRGSVFSHSVILASATPSLESLENAKRGRYAHIILPERPGAITLPDIDLIDLKDSPPEKGDFLSQPLIKATQSVLERGEQALLYLNRRGYAPLIICRQCGEKLRSPKTDSWLVAHQARGRAICHLTGFSMPMPSACPKCETEGGLVTIGPGVERIAEEAARHFPEAHIEILSSDTAGNPAKISDRMARMESGDIDILVGTQMVVKGHNFPHLTFVGVIDGDLSLHGGDPRAGERTYQTLVQVAGRAGRAQKSGRALIQTHQPEHPALMALAAGDRARFVSVELEARDMFGLPPFGRIALMTFRGPDMKQVEALASAALQKAPRTEGIEIFGPSEPPIGLIRGQFRRRLFIQAEKNINLSRYMSLWRERVKLPSKYRLLIDIDPQSFF